MWNQVFSGVVGRRARRRHVPGPALYDDRQRRRSAARSRTCMSTNPGPLQRRVPGRAARVERHQLGRRRRRRVAASRSRTSTSRNPGDSVTKINAAARAGKEPDLHTRRVRHHSSTMLVWRPNTVVLGLGHATLTANKKGATPLAIADVPGHRRGRRHDRSRRGKLSPVLLKVGGAVEDAQPVRARCSPEQPDHAERRVLPRRRSAHRQGHHGARDQRRQRAHRPYLGVARRPRRGRLHERRERRHRQVEHEHRNERRHRQRG